MDSVKKTQNKFLSEAKRETRSIIKATKQITTIPKLKTKKWKCKKHGYDWRFKNSKGYYCLICRQKNK